MINLDELTTANEPEPAAKEKRIEAIKGKGYGACRECELPRERHCRNCKHAWRIACDDR
ncbi:hypothetical protein [Streptomyces noursei]|uniref:hypothetical protein n=1 Tax=Streptomyces noursei TaxID=1971 RepID=UPI0030F0F66C